MDIPKAKHTETFGPLLRWLGTNATQKNSASLLIMSKYVTIKECTWNMLGAESYNYTPTASLTTAPYPSADHTRKDPSAQTLNVTSQDPHTECCRVTWATARVRADTHTHAHTTPLNFDESQMLSAALTTITFTKEKKKTPLIEKKKTKKLLCHVYNSWAKTLHKWSHINFK